MPTPRFLTRFASVAAIFLLPALAPAYSATVSSGEVSRPEGQRHFLLAQPAQPGSDKLPLVIVLHGHSGSASMTFGRERLTDPASAWLSIADREKVLVIAPDGWKGSDNKQGWNDCRSDAPSNPRTDDVGFINELIDEAIAKNNADPSRVYISGISNGGGMTYRLATEIGPRLAAVAVLSALMPTNSLCKLPEHPLSVLATHGTNDKIMPYEGGEVGHFFLRGRGYGMSVEDSVKIWRDLASLTSPAAVTEIPHRDTADHTSATRYVWGEDSKQLQVEFLKIQNGGHLPPSISRRLPWIVTALLGKQNADLEFADEAWAFFKDKRAGLKPAVK